MADVKWIKITTDMFDNRKIKHLRKLPEGNNIVLIWVMLLTMAGRCNSGGMIFLTENIPYTPKMLADELDFEENTIRLALEALERLGMIVLNNDFFSIAGWNDHQSADKLEEMREKARIRKRRQREKAALMGPETSDNCPATVTGRHNAEGDIEEDIDIDIDEEREVEGKRVNYQLIADMYNETCVSFPKLRTLSDSRKKAIRARLNTYTMDDFKRLFEMAEASSFLKGKNKRNWSATFDWLIQDSNMAKVLDGNYDDQKGGGTHESTEQHNGAERYGNFL